jgi:colanic acid/amylovoran biosynthesis glycosyltransferase
VWISSPWKTSLLIAMSSRESVHVASLAKKVPLLACISDHIQGLRARGSQVDTFVLMPAQPGDNPQSPAIGEWRVLGQPPTTTGRFAALLAESIRSGGAHPLRSGGILSAALRGGAGQVAGRFSLAVLAAGAQILHNHLGNFAASIIPVSELTGLPLVVSFYGWDASAAPRQNPDLYVRLFAEAAAVISLSEEMNATLVALGCPAEKLHIVHIAVRGGELRTLAGCGLVRDRGERAADEPLNILAACRLVEKKGLDDALEALALLARRNVPFSYRIIGDGPLMPDLKNQARRLGLEEQVSFVGSMPRQDVIREMGSCDVFFLPSREAASGDREGTPTVLIEAGALGIPCVATFHAGTPEIILDGQTGLLAAERDVEQLATHLQSLAGDQNLCRRLGQAAQEHIDKDFELDSQCARLEAVYRSCLGSAS